MDNVPLGKNQRRLFHFYLRGKRKKGTAHLRGKKKGKGRK